MLIQISMARVGDVRTFENFLAPVPEPIDVESYDTVVIWCESVSRFITAGKYEQSQASMGWVVERSLC